MGEEKRGDDMKDMEIQKERNRVREKQREKKKKFNHEEITS